MMTNTEKLKIVNELLPFLNSNKDCKLFPRKASLIANLKPWHKGATLQNGVKEITVAELMALNDNDLIELQKKVFTAQKAKEAATRQARYHLK